MGCPPIKYILVVGLLIFELALTILVAIAFSLYASNNPFWQFSSALFAFFFASIFAFVATIWINCMMCKAKRDIHNADAHASRDSMESTTAEMGLIKGQDKRSDQSTPRQNHSDSNTVGTTLFLRKLTVFGVISILSVVIGFILFVINCTWAFHLVGVTYAQSEILVVGGYSNGFQRILVRDGTRSYDSVRITYATTSNPNVKFNVTTPIKKPPTGDFTAIIILSNLSPLTEYTYEITYLATNKPDDNRYTTNDNLKFTTLQDAGGSGSIVNFTLGSCILHNFFNAFKGFETVIEADAQFGLFVGDFIYSDHPWYIGTTKEDYDRHYREAFSDIYLSSYFKLKQNFFMYDDHEVYDNWDKQDSAPYYTAMDSWMEYNGGLNPPAQRDPHHYFNFTTGNNAFFVMDTRRFRSGNSLKDDSSKSMLGATQLQDLKDWLISVNSTSTFKFLVSSVPWTANARDTDSWYGYLTERNDLLSFIFQNSIGGVTLLSGDRHWSGVFEIVPGIFEVTISPLDAFSDPNPTIPKTPPMETMLYGAGAATYVGFIETDDSGSVPTLYVKILKSKTNIKPAPIVFEQKFNLTSNGAFVKA